MLLEDCRRAEELNEKTTSIEKLKKQAEFLGRFQNDLAELEKGMTGDTEKLLMFANNGITDRSEFPETGAIITALRDLKNNIKSDYSNINQGNYYVSFKQYLRNFHDDANAMMNEKWKNWINVQIRENLSESIIRSFAELKKETVANIIGLRNELISYKNNVPQRQTDLQKIMVKIERYNSLLEELPMQDMPDEVKAFLEQLGRDTGAGLEYLTEKVVNWLREKKLFNELTIVAKADKLRASAKAWN